MILANIRRQPAIECKTRAKGETSCRRDGSGRNRCRDRWPLRFGVTQVFMSCPGGKEEGGRGRESGSEREPHRTTEGALDWLDWAVATAAREKKCCLVATVP